MIETGFTLHTWSDGGCKPNPGPAQAAAIVKTPEGETVARRGIALSGVATNNIAEWTGFLSALATARDLGATCVIAHVDSELVARQFTGAYSAVGELAELRDRARAIAAEIGRVEVVEIPRERNAAADRICQQVREGTFREDDEGDAPSDPITISFAVTVTLSRGTERDARASGDDRRKIITAFAKRLRDKLALCAGVGDHVEVTRI